MKTTFSKLIATKRKELGISQRALATKLGYAHSQGVSNWERGTAYPPKNKLKAYAKVLKTPVNTMIDSLVFDYKKSLKTQINKRK